MMSWMCLTLALMSGGLHHRTWCADTAAVRGTLDGVSCVAERSEDGGAVLVCEDAGRECRARLRPEDTITGCVVSDVEATVEMRERDEL